MMAYYYWRVLYCWVLAIRVGQADCQLQNRPRRIRIHCAPTSLSAITLTTTSKCTERASGGLYVHVPGIRRVRLINKNERVKSSG